MKLTIQTEKGAVTVRMGSDPAAGGFVDTLPRKMKLTRYDDREFYGEMGQKLSTDGENIPDFENGDVTYFPGMGTLAIFYNRAGESSQSGLIRLGKIECGLDIWKELPDETEVQIDVCQSY